MKGRKEVAHKGFKRQRYKKREQKGGFTTRYS